MEAERPRAARASERLGRMLVVVPYLVRHPGTELAEGARLFDIPEEELRADLMLLFMAGLPPYDPGDLIDVEIDEGRVYISMADQFARPLKLSRNEALALYLRGTELLATPGLPEASALKGALDKLAEGLGAETLGEAGRIATAEAGRPAELLNTLRDSARDRARLRIDYYAHSSGEWSTREIDPEEVFSSLGNWYVAAWDVSNDAERLFRADRIRSAERTGEVFSPRGLSGAGRALYTPTDEDVAVRLLLAPGARWVADYYAVRDPVERPGRALELTLPSKRLGWVAGLLLRLGSDAQILDPADLRERVKDLAERTLARYRQT
ncbi:MAG: WYL domain-containing protein [Actinobacteria bacterium]|nr:WYL domain-containing protein [Actinomycetota bacterium]